MRTIVKPVEPQPVLADPKKPGRWIWGPKEPITDMCRNGNSVVSWWNDSGGGEDLLPAKYCPIERPPTAKVEVVHDGERWSWVVRVPERKKR